MKTLLTNGTYYFHDLKYKQIQKSYILLLTVINSFLNQHFHDTNAQQNLKG